ncbi:MAG TPA: pitrilysin family protein [Kofleriaceae bacterium]|nr:pitrilysin family protein [Kofleriaceae bacterium]
MPWTLDIAHPFSPHAGAPAGAGVTAPRALEVRRHRLHNGLTLLHLADASAPIVSYQTWLRVGSRHELPGQTGMAHLFEHLMFNQTRAHPAGEFDLLIERTGGDTNAATWVDWTYYRDSVPARDLPTVVELEADRLENLVLESAQLESEREVVANERMQRVDDDIDGFADEELMRLAFRVHPYRWPTIGWMEDIRSMSLDQVRRFYRTFYAPNNATLVVVGAVGEAELLELVERRYGHLGPASIPEVAAPEEPAQDGERRARFTKPTAAARLLQGYRAVGQGHPDWPVLSFLAALLTSGPSSRLYRRLVVEREMATHVDCDVAPFRDPALLRIVVHLTREHTAEEAEAEIADVIGRLATAPVSEEELEKVRSVVETDFWAELEGMDGRAEALGHFETTLGDFRRLFDTAAALVRVSAEDVQRAVRSYLVPQRRSTVIIDPDPAALSGDGDDGEVEA